MDEAAFRRAIREEEKGSRGRAGICGVETLAPIAAVLAELPQHYQEREFSVDPRRLERVRIVKRFAE